MDHGKIVTKSTLLSIDSMFRNIYPKNICSTEGRLLPPDPIQLTQNSKEVVICFPKHNLMIGDNITIQNVVGLNRTLSNFFFLINNFNYVVVAFGDTMIDTYYKNYNNNNSLYSMIEIVGSQTESNIMGNILFNSIPGYKQTLLYSDIPQLNIDLAYNNLSQLVREQFNITDDMGISNFLTNKCLYFQLPSNYMNTNANYYAINQVFRISYQHIGGIQLGYLNANFPISNINYQSNHMVTNIIDSNYFSILLNYTSYATMNGGGKTVQIMKIINTMTGYPEANNYVISLKKSFNNVTKIELVSMEMPFVDIVIRKNVNDKLYWKHIEDGDTMYNVVVDEGFYSTDSLANKLVALMNKVPRITSTNTEKVYNHFDIDLETNIQKITFRPYNLTKLPNCLSINLEIISNIPYYILNIKQSNNFVNVGDIVTLTSATGVTYSDGLVNYMIAPSYINKTYNVYSINIATSSYNVIIGPQNGITEVIVNETLNGGEDTIVRTPTYNSFYFNRMDTMGNVLGFLNVGSPYSIIDYNTSITNMDPYIVPNNMNAAGNMNTYSSGFINLSGRFNYIVMYLNNIEYVYFNNNMNAAFAKISLNGNPGDILFDTFVPTPDNIYCKVFPISTLTDITVNFMYPDGTPVNFRNINHSFTLRITEEHRENETINLNSQSISYVDEFKKVYLPST
jgi:hypothetical protein